MNEITGQRSPGVKTFFHATRFPLALGSVIEPGNWGRGCNAYRSNDNLYTLLREIIFEQVRCQQFPHFPSRLNCVFLAETAHGLQHFLQVTERFADLAYEVTLEQSDAPVFRACYHMPTIPADRPLLPGLQEQAFAYWRGDGVDSGRIEILATTAIRVVRRIDHGAIHHN